MARTSSRPIGYLDANRLVNIPREHWNAHEFSFYLHDQLLQMLVQYEQSGVHNVVVEALRKAAIGHEERFEDLDILGFMKANGFMKPYEHHILSHVSLAVTGDLLNFLYEALSAFEKRKFSVGFSLLRKPMKEHLLFLCWLLADKDDFLARFEANNHATLNNLSKERKVEIFAEAITKIATPSMFNADLIWDIIYSKNNTNSFEPLFQRATHLVTSMGDLLKTEDRSLNFVFEHPGDNQFFNRLYSFLPYILIFTVQVGLEVFNRIHRANKLTYSHLVVTTMGCYEALFSGSRAQNVAKILNKAFHNFLKCAHCKKSLHITKGNGIELFLKEHMECTHCSLSSPVPLYWLFGLANFSVTSEVDANTD